MKFYAVNGSPRKNWNTATLLDHALEGIKSVVPEADCERIDLYDHTYTGCISCFACKRVGGKSFGKCAKKDEITEVIDKLSEADGIIFGSPVYFAHPSGRLLAFMDRAFYSGGAAFQFKPAAAVLSARRAGTTASFDVINKYFTICSMPVVSATYWNHVYGAQPEEVAKDKEGLMTMYNIGKNMAWLLKCIALGRENGLPHPDNEKVLTNFIR